jgi:hypothetical protein
MIVGKNKFLIKANYRFGATQCPSFWHLRSGQWLDGVKTGTPLPTPCLPPDARIR